MKLKNKSFPCVPKNARMENKVTGLNWTIVSQAVIEKADAELASLARLSLDVSQDFRNDGDSVKVECIDSAGTVLRNPTDWQNKDLTTTSVSVEMNRYARPVGLTYADRKNAVLLANKVGTAAMVVMKGVWADIMAALAASGADVIKVGSAGAFTPSTVTEKIWPSITNGADSLFLDKTYYSKLIPTTNQFLPLANGSYGLDGGVHFVEGTAPLVTATAGESTTNHGVGFAARPDALALAFRLPNIDPELGVRTEVIQTALGIPLLLKYWGQPGSETTWFSVDCLMGVAIGNKDKLKLISSQT